MSSKTCVVVGAGAGGLGVSAALLKGGYNIKIFERGLIVGGAARSTNVEGFLLDDGIHYLVDIPGRTRHVDEIGDIFGIKTELAVMQGRQLTLVKNGEEIDMLQLLPISKLYDRAIVKKVFKNLSDSDIDEIEGFMKFMMSELQKAIAELNLKSFDDIILRLPYIPLIDWLRERTKNEKVVEFVLDLAQMNVLIPKESIGTLKSFSVLALFMGLSTGMFKYCYPVHEKYGGFGAFIEPYADYIRDNGGEIATNVAVKKIVIESGKAKGVIIDQKGKDEFVPADVVVCNVSPQMAVKSGLLDPNVFPKEYKEDFLRKVKTVQEGAKRYDVTTINVYMALKKQVTDNDSFIVFIDDDGHVIGGAQSYTIVAPASAPPGKQLFYFTTYLYKQPRDYKIAEKYVHEKFIPALRKWNKDFDENLEWIMQNFSPIQYGELNQQMFSNSEVFDMKTPIDNFYFTGMYTGLVGADGAMLAGVKTAEQILGEKIL